jgi:hypothetical protein
VSECHRGRLETEREKGWLLLRLAIGTTKLRCTSLLNQLCPSICYLDGDLWRNTNARYYIPVSFCQVVFSPSLLKLVLVHLAGRLNHARTVQQHLT